MPKFKAAISLLSILVTTGIIMACSSEPKLTELPITADPQTELDRVASNMANAQSRQVDVLSPKNYSSAKKAWDKAVDGRAGNKDQKEVLHSIALSQGYLDKANSVARVATQILARPIEARKDALSANAQKFFPNETTDADKQLKNLTENIEDNDTSGAEKQGPILEAKYRDIELKSIKKEKLGPAQASVQEALKEGAKTLTPETLAWANQRLAEDEKMIESQRHSTTEVNQASADAVTSANRLLKMVRDAKGSTGKKAEDFAKQIEVNEHTSLEAEQELNKTEGQLASSQNKLANVSAQNSRLELQASIDKKYETARGEFTKEEAEVYKQGDKLLLRLKGLTFASNKAGINSNNFPLLAKVQKVIKEFGSSQVAIEGHTDSIGNKKLNEDLSTRRAEAVQSYLVSNNNVPQEKISATGYGDSKPIATNKTALGRAQNRRVDVIITGATALQ